MPIGIKRYKGAVDALNKITDVLPTNIKNNINSFALRVGPPAPETLANEDLSALREAIANQNKIYVVYKSEDGKESQRIVWPFTIGYFTDERLGFLHFLSYLTQYTLWIFTLNDEFEILRFSKLKLIKMT